MSPIAIHFKRILAVRQLIRVKWALLSFRSKCHLNSYHFLRMFNFVRLFEILWKNTNKSQAIQ